MITALLTTFSLLAVPTPLVWEESTIPAAGVSFNSLDSGAGSLWGVGFSQEDRDDWDRPVAARWQDGRWVPTAQPREFGYLHDVAVRTADDVWAVGAAAGPNDPERGAALVQHWDGKVWREITLPGHQDAVLISVAIHQDEVWVLGSEWDGEINNTFAERYNGKSWLPITDKVLSTHGDPRELVVVAPDNLWVAVSEDGIKHFDGQRWTKAELPGPHGALINDLAVVAPNDIWAVGHLEDPTYYRRPVAYHYDGKRWTQVPTPAQTGEPLAVEVVDGAPIVVGDDPSSRGLVLRWTSAGFVNEPAPATPSFFYNATVHEGRFWAFGPQPGKIDGVADTYLAHTRP